jgi:membrane protease YdiL (CAAX protease family)
MNVDAHILTWIFFFVASFLICFQKMQKAGWLIALVAYILAFISGQITIIGIAWLILTAVLLFLATGYLSGCKQVFAHIAFMVCSILLFLHMLPGFQNWRIFDKVKFSEDAAPFTMYLNLDKPFIGLVLFTFLGSTLYAGEMRAKALLKAIAIPLATIVVICLGLGLLLHFITWEPKFPPGALIWMLNNLLLVAISEEAFFRGYLQGFWGNRLFREKMYIPLFIAAFLFGIAHTTGGPALMLLAFIAGIGYGFAYRKGGIIASVLTHFGFNLLHFLLFTYPMLSKIHG